MFTACYYKDHFYRDSMQVKLMRNEDGVSEWMMIEMQGSFEFQSDVSGSILGHFAWQSDSSASLILGHQLFDGKLSLLEKPFLVVDKTRISDSSPSASQTDSSVKACDIVGIVRRKLIFEDRPKSIVTNVDV